MALLINRLAYALVGCPDPRGKPLDLLLLIHRPLSDPLFDATLKLHHWAFDWTVRVHLMLRRGPRKGRYTLLVPGWFH